MWFVYPSFTVEKRMAQFALPFLIEKASSSVNKTKIESILTLGLFAKVILFSMIILDE